MVVLTDVNAIWTWPTRGPTTMIARMRDEEQAAVTVRRMLAVDELRRTSAALVPWASRRHPMYGDNLARFN